MMLGVVAVASATAAVCACLYLFVRWVDGRADAQERADVEEMDAINRVLQERWDAERARKREREARVDAVAKLAWVELRARCERAHGVPCECATRREVAARIVDGEDAASRAVVVDAAGKKEDHAALGR